MKQYHLYKSSHDQIGLIVFFKNGKPRKGLSFNWPGSKGYKSMGLDIIEMNRCAVQSQEFQGFTYQFKTRTLNKMWDKILSKTIVDLL